MSAQPPSKNPPKPPPPSAAEIAQKNAERFETTVTILIALVSTVIALAASQAAVLSGDATAAQHDGVLAKINLERIDGESRVLMARERRVFTTYDSAYDLYLLTYEYARQQQKAERPEHSTRLYQEATAYLEDSNLAYSFLNSNYVLEDEEGNDVDMDDANFIADRQQQAAIFQDVDFTDDFEDANNTRSAALTTAASVIVLFVSILFLTWAQISRSALKWVWLLAGLLISLGIVALYLLASVWGMFGG